MNCKICGGKHHALGLCRKHYSQLPKVKEYHRKYQQRPEVKERYKEYYQRSEVKEHRRKCYTKEVQEEYQKNSNARKLYYVMDKIGLPKNTQKILIMDGITLDSELKKRKII